MSGGALRRRGEAPRWPRPSIRPRRDRTAAPIADAGRPPVVGVLAVQGAFAAHRAVLARLGATVVEVRIPADLEGVEALVLPGGESTTISMLLGFNGLTEPLRRAVVDDGLPTSAPAPA